MGLAWLFKSPHSMDVSEASWHESLLVNAHGQRKTLASWRGSIICKEPVPAALLLDPHTHANPPLPSAGELGYPGPDSNHE